MSESEYKLNEVYQTIQGEGAHAGTPVIMVRFARCNLKCAWCDTDYSGKFSADADQLVDLCVKYKPVNNIVFTGGEPALQVDLTLLRRLKSCGFQCAIETNGTVPLSGMGFDWITVSPKPQEKGFELRQTYGDELKLIYPYIGGSLKKWEGMDFDHLFLQPCDDADFPKHVKEVIDLCYANPRWRLSLQTHKLIGIR